MNGPASRNKPGQPGWQSGSVSSTSHPPVPAGPPGFFLWAGPFMAGRHAAERVTLIRDHPPWSPSMLTNRRSFLQTAGLVAWGLNVPAFLSRTAAAAPMLGKKGSKDTILVVVELTGGNDGLNTVIPFKDPQYAKLRPTLKLAEKDLKKINDEVGMHPSMTGFAELLQDKALCVVQGVGYPNPSQSHFRSMDAWQGGSLDKTISE